MTNRLITALLKEITLGGTTLPIPYGPGGWETIAQHWPVNVLARRLPGDKMGCRYRPADGRWRDLTSCSRFSLLVLISVRIQPPPTYGRDRKKGSVIVGKSASQDLRPGTHILSPPPPPPFLLQIIIKNLAKTKKTLQLPPRTHG